MDVSRKVIVGYDLCDDYSQISCYSYKTNEPIPICKGETEGDFFPIPTALCVNTDTGQWLFGEEAVKCAQNGAGIMVDRLLTKLRTEEVFEIYQTKFTGVALLEKFLRKSLTLVKNYFPTEQISKIVVSIRDTEPVLVDKIYEALSLLGIEKDRAVVISQAGAYLYYALSQDRSFWLNDVGLFDFNEEGLTYYQIKLNRRSKPMIAGLTKTDLTDSLNYEMLKNKNNNIAYIFGNLANEVLYKQIISTLYFTGKGFEGDWADEVIKSLCVGRRVFFGQNLFTKGACYAAKELSGDQKLNDIILLNDDMITTSLAVRVYCDTKFIEVPLTGVGEIWYEVGKNLEVIKEGKAELDIVSRNVVNRDAVWQKLSLDQFPERPDRTTRFKIDFTCKDKNTGIIKVTDLGFGEFFPDTGTEMIFTLEI